MHTIVHEGLFALQWNAALGTIFLSPVCVLVQCTESLSDRMPERRTPCSSPLPMELGW